MRHLTLLLSAILIFLNLQAQPSTSSTGAYGGNFAGPPVFLKDVFRQPLKSIPYADVEGSPFLTSDWLFARIVFDDNKWVDSVKIRLNLYTHKVHFFNETGEEMTMSMPVKQVKIIQYGSSFYNSVFLVVPGEKRYFHQVVAEGNLVTVVKKLAISQWQINTFGDGVRKQFKEDFEFAYLFGEQLVSQSRECNNLPVTYSSDEKFRDFINTQKLRCNKVLDMMKIAAFINENYSK